MNELFPESINLVTADDIIAYLQALGWRQVEHPNKNIFVYQPIEGAEVSEKLVFPAKKELSDFRERIRDSIRLLAEIEKQPVDIIVKRILNRDVDIIRARIKKTASSISLELASQIIPLLRDFIGFAACAQSDPKPFFSKASGLAKDFTEHCRFGHTFPGSFGFTIECPISLPKNRLLFPNAEVPTERQIIERVAQGFVFTNEALTLKDTEPLVSNYASGFNANMCEVLAEAYEVLEGNDLEFSISWSSELKPRTIFDERQRFNLGFEGCQFLRTAAKELQRVDRPIETTIIGKIWMLKAEESPYERQEEFEHIISMYWEIEKNIFVKVRILLTTAEYRLACDAHKEGRRIKIVGFPEKRGKFWHLDKPSGFEVLPK